jgi:gamma-glutamyl hercynylcysteine S-oxide synthase
MTGAAAVAEAHHLTLLDQFVATRADTDRLFEILRPEALYDRPIAERHRIVFYIGHLEAFDHNLLAPTLGLESFHPELDKLFAFGIDPVGGGLPTDQPSDWPRIEEVRAYVQGVRERLDDRLGGQGALALRLHVALEHRLMHAETLAYMFHQLPLNRKLPRSQPPLPSARLATSHMVGIPAGVATLGLPRPELSRENSTVFGWDNEFEAHQVEVPPFAIDAYNVSNGQYLEFIRAGGYSERSLWSDADWNWLQSEQVSHPRFWIPPTTAHGDALLYRTMFDERPLPLDWPVYVSHAEASAYARWKGKALPTEAQFHRAAYGSPNGEQDYPWGAEPPEARHGNFDFHRWDPVAVASYPAGRSAYGVDDLVGNGWEWTSSLFEPFSGFEPFAFYQGYSANFFDGKHYVIKGGSSRTAAPLLRRSFRNWFQPHYPFVYATFRCVEN